MTEGKEEKRSCCSTREREHGRTRTTKDQRARLRWTSSWAISYKRPGQPLTRLLPRLLPPRPRINGGSRASSVIEYICAAFPLGYVEYICAPGHGSIGHSLGHSRAATGIFGLPLGTFGKSRASSRVCSGDHGSHGTPSSNDPPRSSDDDHGTPHSSDA